MLNGWRRFGITLTVLYAIGTAAVCITNYVTRTEGAFVVRVVPAAQSLPSDLRKDLQELVSKGKEKGKQPVSVKMPDETIVEMPDALPPELEARLKSWLEASQPKLQVQWFRFLAAMFGLPLFIWLLIETSVTVIRWIGKGFGDKHR